MSEKHPVNSSVTFAKVVSGGNIPNEDQQPLLGKEANNSSESATENEVKSPDDWPSLNVVAQQKCEENKPSNKSTVKKAVNNFKDKTQETTGEETANKAEEVSALSPSATINSPAGGSKKVSKNSWKKLDIEVDYNTAREVLTKRREMRREFERRERPQRRNTVCGRDLKEGRGSGGGGGGGNFVGGGGGSGRDGRGGDVGRENNNCSEPVRTTTNFGFRQNNRAFKDNKFNSNNNYNNNHHRRQISKEGNENVVVVEGGGGGKNEEKNNRDDVQKSPPTNNSAQNNNNNEQSQDQSYWYFDDISNGYYYQHSGSQGWKKNSKDKRQQSNNNTYRPQRQFSPNHGRYSSNRQKFFKNSASTQTEQTNNVAGMNNSQGGGHRSVGGYQSKSHHHHHGGGGGGPRHVGPNNAYKYNNNNKRMDEQLFSNSYFCSNNNNCINHHWTTSSLQQLNISGISPTVVTATAVPSAPSTSLLSPNGLIPFPLVVANTLQTAAVVVATTDQVPTTATTQFTPTIIATQFPQNTIFMAPITTPYVPALEEFKLGELVRGQIEYYFSADNLQKDFFLRRKMDAEGFLPLSLIASFPRIRSLTDDVSFILSCLRGSEGIEFSADELKIRPRINPLYWPLHESSPQSGTETPLPAAISDDDGNK